jgi:DNA replication protein DnaC
LEEFIKNDRENRPCIVYGASGCGKTSVLAKVATEVCIHHISILFLFTINENLQALKWWSDRSVSVILRFLGYVLQSRV